MDRRHFTKTLAASGVALAAGRAIAGPGTHSLPGAAPALETSIEETPVVFEVAINGSTTKAINRLAPGTAEEQAAEIIKCLDAGATIVHAHSNKPSEDVATATQAYIDMFQPVRKKHPYGIVYPTANFDPKVYHEQRRVWPGAIQSGHYRPLAKAGLANMVLLDTGVVPLAGYDKQGVPIPDNFWWYGFWPDDTHIILDVCKELGTGTSISIFEPGWMKNVIAMARAGSLPRGSKLNIYFAGYDIGAMPPPIPEALQLYLKMMEGLDLKWSVGTMGVSVMDTQLARMALENGGSFRVGLEDWSKGPSNLDQMARAKELIDKVGRRVVTGAEAIKYLDIPFPSTRPKD